MRLRQRKKTSLSVCRRHEADCAHRSQGRSYTKCSCPLWMQGVHDGQPIRQSLGTRSMQEAVRQVAAESAQGIAPRAAHRTGRKPLDLSGSCHRLKAAAFRQDQSAPPVSG